MSTHGGTLQGKVAVVTGSSKGIGKAMAAALAAEGAAVMLTSRKQDALDSAADEIRAATPGARLATYSANAGEEDQAAACVAATLDQLGAVDVLVNNAATNPYAGPVIDTDLAAWDKTFRVNLRGFLVWTQQAWRAWQRDHGGTVINISSVGGIAGTGGLGTYNVTKAGVIHLTKILANELAPGVTWAPSPAGTQAQKVGTGSRSCVPADHEPAQPNWRPGGNWLGWRGAECGRRSWLAPPAA